MTLLRDTILQRGYFVCWPIFGSGNALCRLLIAHDEFLYNPMWNTWGYKQLNSPLEVPDEFNTTEKGFYSTAHYSAPGLSHSWIDKEISATEAFEQSLSRPFKHGQHKQWLTKCIREGKKILIPVYTHNCAEHFIEEMARPTIQLCFKSYETVLKRQQSWALKENTPAGEFVKRETLQFALDQQKTHPLVCNLCLEDLFFGTYNTFLQQYHLMCQHFALKPNKSEKCWAFVLYYRDRLERGTPLDKEKLKACLSKRF